MSSLSEATRRANEAHREYMIAKWHYKSDHGKDGTPLGGYLCNCERVVDRVIKFWGLQ